MDIANLKPGLFKTSQTVTNPKPDRRQRYEWTALPEVKEGARFVVEDAASRFETMPNQQVFEIRPENQSRGLYVWVHKGQIRDVTSPLAVAIIEALVPREEDFMSVLRSGGGDSDRVSFWTLKHLVESGKLSLADVKAAIEADRAKSEEQINADIAAVRAMS